MLYKIDVLLKKLGSCFLKFIFFIGFYLKAFWDFCTYFYYFIHDVKDFILGDDIIYKINKDESKLYYQYYRYNINNKIIMFLKKKNFLFLDSLELQYMYCQFSNVFYSIFKTCFF